MQDISSAIYIASTYQQAEELGLHLISHKPTLLGLDTETTTHPQAEKVSLLQLSTTTTQYLFQLGRIWQQERKLPLVISRILSNPEIVKVGVALDTDRERLFESYGIIIRSGVDIQALARTLGCVSLSLHDLGYLYLPNFQGKDPLGHKGNWDGDLTHLEIYYAAMDAKYSLLIYLNMLNINLPQDNNQNSTTDEEEKVFLLWVKNYLSTRTHPMPYLSMINYIVNSYAPWRKKYLENERRKRATSYLDLILDKLSYDPATRKFIPNPTQ